MRHVGRRAASAREAASGVAPESPGRRPETHIKGMAAATSRSPGDRSCHDVHTAPCSPCDADRARGARLGRVHGARSRRRLVLAAASPAAVLRAWAGMGYNRRALNLQRAAAAIVERHGGAAAADGGGAGGAAGGRAIHGAGGGGHRLRGARRGGRHQRPPGGRPAWSWGMVPRGPGLAAPGPRAPGGRGPAGGPRGPGALDARGDGPGRHALPARPRLAATRARWRPSAAGATALADGTCSPLTPAAREPPRCGARRAPRARLSLDHASLAPRPHRGAPAGRSRRALADHRRAHRRRTTDAAVERALADLAAEGMIERRPDGAVRLPSS